MLNLSKMRSFGNISYQDITKCFFVLKSFIQDSKRSLNLRPLAHIILRNFLSILFRCRKLNHDTTIRSTSNLRVNNHINGSHWWSLNCAFRWVTCISIMQMRQRSNKIAPCQNMYSVVHNRTNKHSFLTKLELIGTI